MTYGSSSKPVSLDPFQTIVGVNWPASFPKFVAVITSWGSGYVDDFETARLTTPYCEDGDAIPTGSVDQYIGYCSATRVTIGRGACVIAATKMTDAADWSGATVEHLEILNGDAGEVFGQDYAPRQIGGMVQGISPWISEPPTGELNAIMGGPYLASLPGGGFYTVTHPSGGSSWQAGSAISAKARGHVANGSLCVMSPLDLDGPRDVFTMGAKTDLFTAAIPGPTLRWNNGIRPPKTYSLVARSSAPPNGLWLLYRRPSS